MLLNDVRKLRCGDYFSPRFHPFNGELMNPIEFKKISKEHFYTEIHRALTDNFRRIYRLYALVQPDLDEVERKKLFPVFDQLVELSKTVELISLPYRPIGEKNE